MSERQKLADIIIDSAQDPDEYSARRRDVRLAICNDFDFGSGDAIKDAFADRLFSPIYIEDRFFPNSPASKAAVVMGAVEYNAHRNRRETDQTYAEMWHGTELYVTACLGDNLFSGILPRLESAFVTIDLAKMHRQHEDRLRHDWPKETVVITGLNGVGKTTVIGAMREFVQECGVETRFEKFPRTWEKPFGELNYDVLMGQVDLDSAAMQFLFVADALEAEQDLADATLQISDRHPAVDGLVYGPEKMETALLATRDVFTGNSGVMWTMILDRHPAVALGAVEKRKTGARVFERKVEQMAEQLVRFTALTALPGTYWFNNDFPPDNERAVLYSGEKVIRTMIDAGIIGRALRNQGVVGSEGEGNKIAEEVYWSGQGYGKHW